MDLFGLILYWLYHLSTYQVFFFQLTTSGPNHIQFGLNFFYLLFILQCSVYWCVWSQLYVIWKFLHRKEFDLLYKSLIWCNVCVDLRKRTFRKRPTLFLEGKQYITPQRKHEQFGRESFIIIFLIIWIHIFLATFILFEYGFWWKIKPLFTTGRFYTRCLVLEIFFADEATV